MVNISPRETRNQKASEPAAPQGFGFGTFLGATFTIMPPQLFHIMYHSRLNTAHYPLYTAHCPLYTAHCTLYTAHYTLYTEYVSQIVYLLFQYRDDCRVVPHQSLYWPQKWFYGTRVGGGYLRYEQMTLKIGRRKKVDKIDCQKQYSNTL